MIENVLKQIGLKEKEIQIYLALLPIGVAPASLLAKQTGITRSTAQYTCQQLEKKDLITSIFTKNTYYYSPEPPEKLQYLLDKKIKNIKNTKDELSRMGSELMGMINPHTVLPKVRFYEGVSGLIDMFEEQLELEEDEVTYGMHRFYEDAPAKFIDYIQNDYDRKRKLTKYKSFIIWADNESTLERLKLHDEMNRVSLVVPEEDFPIDSSYQIYRDKVAFYSYKKTDMTGVIIQNEHVKTTMLSNFKLAWSYAKTLKKNSKYKDVSI